MIITIFGASGMVGRHLVKQALLTGFKVRAFGRNIYTAGFPEKEDLEFIKGAVFDEMQVLHAIEGADAVLSALGGAVDGADQTRSLGLKNIVHQMQKTSVKRIVAVGGMGVLEAEEDKKGFILDQASYPQEYYPVGQEHLKAYQILESSGLDWTMVCPPNIVQADVTGMYQTKANMMPNINNVNIHINAADLAMFMLNEVKRNNFVKQRVGISNTE